MNKEISSFCFIVLLFAASMALTSALFAPQIVYAAEGTQIVSANTLINTAAVIIRQRAGVAAESDDLSVNVLNSPQAVTAPEGDLSVGVDLPYGVRYNAPTTANVTVSVNGRVIAITTLKFETKMYKQVLVAGRSISSGEALTIDSLRYERMDIGRLMSGYYTDANKVLGLITRRAITPGLAINQYMIEKPIIIKRGSSVTLVARIGGLEVTAAGQALQDGYEGKIIPIQNLSSRKIVSAKVLDENSVQVLTFK